MIPSVPTLDSLLTEMRGQERQAEWLAAKLAEFQAIRDGREALELARQEMEARHAEERRAWEARRRELREKCPHPQVSERVGAMPGECARTCDLCGREMPRERAVRAQGRAFPDVSPGSFQ